MKWKWTRGCLSSHALTAGCLWEGVVVENHVDVEFGSHAALDLAEEPQKLLMPVARQALVDDLPGGYVEGSKEYRRDVTFVVMGHGSSAPLLEGKTWLGAVEGLDLALLVESEDNGPLRGIDVETHHVAQLFNEVDLPRFSRQLEVRRCGGAVVHEPARSARWWSDGRPLPWP